VSGGAAADHDDDHDDRDDDNDDDDVDLDLDHTHRHHDDDRDDRDRRSTTTTTTMGGTTTTIVRTCTFRDRHAGARPGDTAEREPRAHRSSGLHISPAGPDGVRAIFIPASGTHFDPAPLPAGLGTLCVRGNGDGTGVLDCDGGLSSYDNTVQRDQQHDRTSGRERRLRPGSRV